MLTFTNDSLELLMNQHITIFTSPIARPVLNHLSFEILQTLEEPLFEYEISINHSVRRGIDVN